MATNVHSVRHIKEGLLVCRILIKRTFETWKRVAVVVSVIVALSKNQVDTLRLRIYHKSFFEAWNSFVILLVLEHGKSHVVVHLKIVGLNLVGKRQRLYCLLNIVHIQKTDSMTEYAMEIVNPWILSGEHVKAVVDWQCLVPKFVLEIDFSQLSKSIRVVRISVQLPFCLTDYLGLRFPATIF